MWERFSYYGMRALLIYYLTATAAHGGLGFTDSKAGAVYGLYTAMVYLMCLGGGWIADLFIGQRRAVFYGGILIAAGEFLPDGAIDYRVLPRPRPAHGRDAGFLKGNVSTIVGQLYAREASAARFRFFDLLHAASMSARLSRRFSAATSANTSAGALGFGLCGLGMLAGLVQYVITGRYLGAAGLHPAVTGDIEADRRRKRTAIRALSAGTAVLVLVAILGATGIVDLNANLISEALGWSLLGISALVFAWLIFFGDWTPEERKRSAAILVLFIASCTFSGPQFEQAGSSLSLFRRARNTQTVTSRDFHRVHSAPSGEFPASSVSVGGAHLRRRAGSLSCCMALAADGKARALQPHQVLKRFVPGRALRLRREQQFPPP